MNLSISPIVQQSTTKKGNDYTKTNAGKYAATGAVTTAAVLTAGEFALKKAKAIKLPTMESLKGFGKSFGESSKTAAKSVIDSAKKLPNTVKTAAKSVVDFVKNPQFGKIFSDCTNFFKNNLKMSKIKEAAKNAGTKVLDHIEKHPVRTDRTLKFAGLAVGAIATGIILDFVINKVRANKADKKAEAAAVAQAVEEMEAAEETEA